MHLGERRVHGVISSTLRIDSRDADLSRNPRHQKAPPRIKWNVGDLTWQTLAETLCCGTGFRQSTQAMSHSAATALKL